ncbi:MAG: hypothetical protein ABL908_02775 [Hyphomicrobium sp.]
MFRIPRSQPWPPAIDLSTVRETLLYMHDDMKRVPGLEGVASALAATLDEITTAEKQAQKARPAHLSPMAARFMPLWR